jgi:hypothetical protein
MKIEKEGFLFLLTFSRQIGPRLIKNRLDRSKPAKTSEGHQFQSGQITTRQIDFDRPKPVKTDPDQDRLIRTDRDQQ